MPWTEHTLEETEDKLWMIARDYFRLPGKSVAQEAQLVAWEQDFRRTVHRLALAAWEAHVTHWSPSMMGIDPEVLEEERDG